MYDTLDLSTLSKSQLNNLSKLEPLINLGPGVTFRNFKDYKLSLVIDPEDHIENPINSISRKSYKINELHNLPKTDWLIKDVLLDGGIATIYGESGSTKSFLAIDLAMNLAIGSDWFGLKVARETPVIYLALEGFSGLVKRIKGWCKNNGITPSNVYIDHDSLHLADLKSVQNFINCYKQKNFNKGLVIIDTLNMAIPDIEENSAASMSGVISKVKLIAEKLNSTILIIHHTGKDETRGMRGSSSLKASMDTILFVKKHGNKDCEWLLEKSKDSECGIGFNYQLKEINLEIDNEIEKTCTIDVLGERSVSINKPTLSAKQIRVLNLIKDRLMPTHSKQAKMDTVIEQCCALWNEHPQAKRTHDMRRIIENLINKKLLGCGSKDGLHEQIWITDKGIKI